jgi:WD40 repeat protein
MQGIAFSPDGKAIATCVGGSVHVWNVATGQQKSCLEVESVQETSRLICGAVAFSPDGKYLAAGSGKGTLRLWDTATWKWVRTLKGHEGPIVGAAFTREGRHLVSASYDSTIRVWDVLTGKLRCCYRLEGEPVRQFALAADGKTIAVLTQRCMLHCWNLTTGKKHWQPKRVNVLPLLGSLAFSPDGKTIAVTTTSRLMLWDALTGNCRNPVTAPTSDLSQLACSADGKVLATSYHDESVWVWSTENWQGAFRWKAPAGRICSLRVGPKQRILVATIEDRNVEPAVLRFWDISARQMLFRIRATRFDTVLVPDNTAIITDGSDGLVLRHPVSGRLLHRFLEPSRNPRSVALSQDGRLLAAVSDNGILLWDTNAVTLLRRFGVKGGPVVELAFSPDARSLIATHQDDQFPRHRRDQVLCLWETATGQVRLRIKERLGHLSPPVISPDCRLLAVSSREGGINIWDLATAKLVATLAWYRGPLAFVPNSRFLLSPGENTTALVWDAGQLLPAPKRIPPALSVRSMERLWHDLASEDAGNAYHALWSLVEQPRLSVTHFLSTKLRERILLRRQLQRLIDDLDSDDFHVRERASRELGKFGRQALPALRAGIRRNPSLEATWRMKRLLKIMNETSALDFDDIRKGRAMEALHYLRRP